MNSCPIFRHVLAVTLATDPATGARVRTSEQWHALPCAAPMAPGTPLCIGCRSGWASAQTYPAAEVPPDAGVPLALQLRARAAAARHCEDPATLRAMYLDALGLGALDVDDEAAPSDDVAAGRAALLELIADERERADLDPAATLGA